MHTIIVYFVDGPPRVFTRVEDIEVDRYGQLIFDASHGREEFPQSAWVKVEVINGD